MREELQKVKEKRMNDKGFSLIELIIVIAIMAILVGIVGTQVMPYLEKSKQSKDKQVLSGILTSATSAFATNAEECPAAAGQSIVITSTGISSTTGTNVDKVAATLAELTGYKYDTTNPSGKGPEFTSKLAKDHSVTITRDDTGKVTVTITGSTDTDQTDINKVFTPISST